MPPHFSVFKESQLGYNTLLLQHAVGASYETNTNNLGSVPFIDECGIDLLKLYLKARRRYFE
jgi:hypothetical protein